MSDFWKIESASQNQTQNISNVNSIIQATKDLLSEKYPHIVDHKSIVTVSYEGGCDHVCFSNISFYGDKNEESITINAHRICLNAADGIRYILFEYKHGIEDIFYCKQEDLKKESIGPTHVARMKEKAQESLKNHIMCALGTMLPMPTIMGMSHEQVEESAEKITQYLLSNGYLKEDYV
jgi:hypothetical protein